MREGTRTRAPCECGGFTSSAGPTPRHSARLYKTTSDIKRLKHENDTIETDTIAALDELRDEEETFHDVVKRLLRETGSEVR